jgi:hypothetical protein
MEGKPEPAHAARTALDDVQGEREAVGVRREGELGVCADGADGAGAGRCAGEEGEFEGG